MTFRYLKLPGRWIAVLALFAVVGSVSASTFYGRCIFKLGDKLKVNIFLETHYMLEGSACDKVREYLLASMHETWSADEPSTQRATIPSITLDLLVKEGDKDQVAVHLPFSPKMFKRGEAGYVQFRDLVRAVGKSGRPGAPHYEEGWEIETAHPGDGEEPSLPLGLECANDEFSDDGKIDGGGIEKVAMTFLPAVLARS